MLAREQRYCTVYNQIVTVRLQLGLTVPGGSSSGYNRIVDQITIRVDTCAESGALVASWDDPEGSGGLTTQSETLSELEGNIREAISAHFEPGEIPKRVRLHLVA
jgi:predicted RNase H-like HicB family nuclease